jgi:hypothetical protein
MAAASPNGLFNGTRWQASVLCRVSEKTNTGAGPGTFVGVFKLICPSKEHFLCFEQATRIEECSAHIARKTTCPPLRSLPPAYEARSRERSLQYP